MYQVLVKDINDQNLGYFQTVKLSMASSFLNIGTASFDVPRHLFDANTGETTLNPSLTEEMISPFNRIYIYHILDEATLVWEGWTSSARIVGDVISFECFDFWGYIERKKIDVGISYTTQSIKTVLETEWANINAVKDTGLVIVTDETQLISPNIEQGQSFQQLLREVIDFGFEVEYSFPNIIIKEKVGRDLTGSDGLSLSYDYREKDNSNIAFPEDLKIDGIDKGNRVLARGSGGTSVTVSNIAVGEDAITVVKNFEKYDDTNGDLTLLADNYLLKINQDFSSLKIVPKPAEFLPGSLMVGDEIQVDVNVEDDLFDTSAVYRIIAVRAQDENYITSIDISQQDPFESAAFNLIDRIKRLEQDVF